MDQNTSAWIPGYHDSPVPPPRPVPGGFLRVPRDWRRGFKPDFWSQQGDDSAAIKPGPRLWMDRPRDGDEIQLGQQCSAVKNKGPPWHKFICTRESSSCTNQIRSSDLYHENLLLVQENLYQGCSVKSTDPLNPKPHDIVVYDKIKIFVFAPEWFGK